MVVVVIIKVWVLLVVVVVVADIDSVNLVDFVGWNQNDGVVEVPLVSEVEVEFECRWDFEDYGVLDFEEIDDHDCFLVFFYFLKLRWVSHETSYRFWHE